jgi:predicted HD superfamily hydrolase involved in NAD metabolism
VPVANMPHSKEYLRRLREELTDDKVSHCVFTAEYLSSFAATLGIPHDEAVTAGLLHDFCRNLDKGDMLEQARGFRIPISESQLEKPVLLHGPVAAEICRREYGISDEVYEAIYWHTTGCPGLGILGQALYLADFAEPTRRFPEAAEARELLRKQGFEHALIYVVEMELLFSQDKQVIDPNTEAFLLWLKTQKTL